MATLFKTIALVGKYNASDISGPVLKLANFLAQRGIEVLMEARTAESIGPCPFPSADAEQIGSRAKLVIVFGGDGTLLNAARQLARFGVPLTGVNQGRLGFMTDIPLNSMLEGVGAVLSGKHTVEERMMLSVEIKRGDKDLVKSLAVNDVVVSRGAMGRMIEFEVDIDGQFVYTQRSDGLIICTPTGSTAYALSNGGPILHPSMRGFALVPICPHALSNRPIAVPDHSRVEIVMLHALHSYAYFDGQSHIGLEGGDKITVRRCENNIRLLHPHGYSYYAMLREKLHWSEAALS